MDPLKLRDQWGYFQTGNNSWIRLHGLISYEIKTTHKISPRNSTWGETKLIMFGLPARKRKKVGSIGRQK